MVVVKKIGENKKEEALELVIRVFMKYEAPDYSDEGVETFKRTAVYNKDYMESITMHGAYENNKIVGVIAMRNNGSHIALFFVDGQYHRKGIGKRLFQTVLEQSTADELTVNSSPYAQEVYHHLGFEDTAPEQVTDGIRYIPMIYKKNTYDIASLIT
ncbi:GNAT family N-acetyltransferase, partial [Lachnotalea glycerini]